MCGVAGYGHQALWLAKSYGAKIYACDEYPAAQQLARDIGAERAFSFEGLKRAARDEKFRVDVVIDFVCTASCESLGYLTLT